MNINNMKILLANEATKILRRKIAAQKTEKEQQKKLLNLGIGKIT